MVKEESQVLSNKLGGGPHGLGNTFKLRFSIPVFRYWRSVEGMSVRIHEFQNIYVKKPINIRAGNKNQAVRAWLLWNYLTKT